MTEETKQAFTVHEDGKVTINGTYTVEDWVRVFQDLQDELHDKGVKYK